MSSNYIISNLRKPSDYAKAVITQDQLLKLAIANDSNIAQARQNIKLGLPPVALTPQQEKSPEELMLDVSKQYSEAVSNLESLGFSYRTAGEIASQLEPDELFKFNQSYPAIHKDITSRYNPKLITPTFFIEYLRQYLEELAASKGLTTTGNLSFITGKFNGLVDTINELKSIFPSKDLVVRLKAKMAPVLARLHPNDQQAYLDEFDALEEVLPDDQIYKDLENLNIEDPVAYQTLQQKIQTALSGVPTNGSIQQLLQQRTIDMNDIDAIANSITQKQARDLRDIYDQLATLTGGQPQQIQQPVAKPQKQPEHISDTPIGTLALYRKDGNIYLEDLQGIFQPQDDQELIDLVDALPSSAFKTEMINSRGSTAGLVSRTKLKAYIKSHPSTSKLTASAVAKQGGPSPSSSQSSQSSQASQSPRSSSSTASMGSVFGIAGSAPASVAGAAGGGGRGRGDVGATTAAGPTTKPLQGIGFKLRKVGKGISIEKEPTYKEFGKYCIHIPDLENKNVLNVKYQSLGRIPDFRPQEITEEYKDMILDLLSNNKLNHSLHRQIPEREKKHFEKISLGAGIFKKFGLNRITAEDDKKEMERFELVKGEIEAGNTNPQLKKELRRFIIKFLNEGKITKQTAFSILLELSMDD